MQPMNNTIPQWGRIATILLAVACFVMLATTTGCPQMAQWRDSQIKTSKDLAEGNTVVIPNPPLTIPGDCYSELPVRDSFTVLAYNRSGRQLELDVLMDIGLEEGSIWLLTRMTELGYGSGDNASRILEGVTYTPAGATAYSSIYVRLDYVDSGSAILRLRATE